MTLSIGENVRRLRGCRGLTQEQFAEILGVSAQAVSRWESRIVYPDLETIPGIANFFGVSLDELTGMDKLREDGNLREIFTRVPVLRADGKLEEAAAELRRGLKLYPNNFGLMSELALTLLRIGGEPGEAISLSERVLAGSTSDKLRSTTAVNLILLYLRAGEQEKAARLTATLGHAWECRELVRAELADVGYREALRGSIRAMLAVICAKIDGAESHVYGKPDVILADGMAFWSVPDDREMLEKAEKFLSE